ncbi:hypothetical protein BX616_002824 [Lobosporangium transversale]|nr:hypothetical protein BX616_002824 [Lobosporangium transversale]
MKADYIPCPGQLPKALKPSSPIVSSPLALRPRYVLHSLHEQTCLFYFYLPAKISSPMALLGLDYRVSGIKFPFIFYAGQQRRVQLCEL